VTAGGAIDVHAHLIPPSIVECLRTTPGTFPGVGIRETSRGPSFQFPDLESSPPVPKAIFDVAIRASWLREHSIEKQIVSPWTDLFGYTLRAGEAAEWSRFLNSELVKAIATEESLRPLATVPLAQPADAIRELEAAQAAGCRGIMIGTATPSGPLDDPAFEDFWAAAAGLSMPIFVHPIFLSKDDRLRDYGLANAVGRANETLIAVARLLFAGVPTRHQDLRLVIAHGGGGLVALLGRLRRNFELSSDVVADPVAGFTRLVFDSIVLEPRALRSLLAFAAPSQILLGSDYPFPWEPDPRRTVEAADLDPEVVEAILVGNSNRVFGL
jgi:aminocarboxymuconate-semialdehyde decarboxylase